MSGFSFYLFYLISTGKIYVFINPKMVKYTFFCALGFIGIALSQIRKVFMISRNSKFKLGYILFILPLVVGFTTKGFDSSIAYTKGVTLTGETKISTNPTNYSATTEIGKNFIEAGVVVFKDSNFYKILNDMNYNMKYYKGKNVEIIGVVYKDKSFKDNEFVISRMMMSCCAADAQIVGLMSSYDNARDLGSGEWIKIEGTIDITMYNKEEMPIIIVKKLTRNEEAGNKYVYP